MSAHLDNQIQFPYLALIASGGHTSLFIARSFDDYENIGLTLDDAAGEAFDKGAKLLGLGFPGGPALDKLAQEGDPSRYKFGKVQVPEFHFSFSGLKSELARLVSREGELLRKADAAASYQRAIVNHLESKAVKALHQFGLSRLVIVGGVACNTELRSRLARLKLEGHLKEWFAPHPQ